MFTTFKEKLLGSIDRKETSSKRFNVVNAGGTSVPAFYIFQKANFKGIFSKNRFPGCSDILVQTPGQMTKKNSRTNLTTLSFSHPLKENPILLILNNHEFHLTNHFIDNRKENEVDLLTTPPNESDKLQPLDICAYMPFKCQY